jgi:hypothetical protein
MVLRIFGRIIGALRSWNNGSNGPAPLGETDGDVDILPTACLRGLRKKDWVVEDQFIATEAFLPDARTAEKRADCGMETSVNWEDNPKVVELTLEDRSTAEHGAARLERAHIESVSSGAAVTAPLLCERQVLPGNDHHGNIVFSKGLNKVIRVQLAGALANKSKLVRRQHDK